MNLKLEATKREPGKKSDSRELRRQGRIPAIIYGEGKPGLPISLDAAEFNKTYRKSIGQMAFFNVSVGGEVYRTIVKEKQIHPLHRDLLHIDFQELHAGKEISLEIPLSFEGEAPGTRSGGLLDISMRTLLCQSLPKNIKDDIVVDISKLEVGETIHVGDLDLGEMNTKAAPELAVVSVHLPRAAKAESDEEGEEGAEGAEESTEE